MVVVLAFSVGVVTGLRTFTGLTAVSWAARTNRLALGGTPLAWLGSATAPLVLTAAAVGELISDKLPQTPSRLIPPAFGARIVVGALAGAAVGAASSLLWPGAAAGAVGAIVGTLLGAKARGWLAGMIGKDLPAALVEDAIAVGSAALIVL